MYALITNDDGIAGLPGAIDDEAMYDGNSLRLF